MREFELEKKDAKGSKPIGRGQNPVLARVAEVLGACPQEADWGPLQLTVRLGVARWPKRCPQ